MGVLLPDAMQRGGGAEACAIILAPGAVGLPLAIGAGIRVVATVLSGAVAVGLVELGPRPALLGGELMRLRAKRASG